MPSRRSALGRLEGPGPSTKEGYLKSDLEVPGIRRVASRTRRRHRDLTHDELVAIVACL